MATLLLAKSDDYNNSLRPVQLAVCIQRRDEKKYLVVHACMRTYVQDTHLLGVGCLLEVVASYSSVVFAVALTVLDYL